MSWETKTDYCGVAVANKLTVKTAAPNKTAQYLEKHGRTGGYAATKVFGERMSPANTYTVEDDVTITGGKLGNVVTADQKKFALESVKWSTGADQEPTVDASSKQVSDTQSLGNYFEIPEFTISPDHVAQIPSFKFPVPQGQTAASVPAFSISGENCELTACSGEVSCSVKTNDKNGLPKTLDVTNGHIVVEITIGQYGETAPTITEASGWDVSSPLTCDEPDSDMPTWKATLTHPLTKTMA